MQVKLQSYGLPLLFFLHHGVKKLYDVFPVIPFHELHRGAGVLVQMTGDHIRDIKAPAQLGAQRFYVLLDALQ